ncbi:unnamed protein product [Choristocarpus tenellus]
MPSLQEGGGFEVEDFPLSPILRHDSGRSNYCYKGGTGNSGTSRFSLRPSVGPSVIGRSAPDKCYYLAADRGDTRLLREWLDCGGQTDVRDADGWTLMMHASIYGQAECVRLLLGRGASVHIVSYTGNTPLHGASANDHLEVVAILVEAGASVNIKNGFGNTALHSATSTGNTTVPQFLLMHGSDPNVENSVGETPDLVEGASPEACTLVREARARREAQIAQRMALCKLQWSWTSGKLESICSDLKTADALHTTQELVEKEEDTSFEAVVAGVVVLPQEVFRRVVGFCSV